MPFFKRKSDKPTGQQKSPPTPQLTPKQKRGPTPISLTPDSPLDTLPNGDIGVPVPQINENGGARRKQLSPRSPGFQDSDSGDLGNLDSFAAENQVRATSRLSKSLGEVLHDRDALAYFIQFMNSLGAGHVIKFWLDAESFQASTWTRIRSHSLNSLSKSSVAGRARTDTGDSRGSSRGSSPAQNESCTFVPNKQTCDNQSPATEQSLKCVSASNEEENAARTLCRMSKSDTVKCVTAIESTDKTSNNTSRLSNDASVDHNQPKKCSSLVYLDLNNEDCLGEKLRKSIEKDAVSIYSKYISLDATHPIGINEKLRNSTISKICREDGQVDPQCFSACQDYVCAIMDKDYFPEFLRSEYHCKHQIDVLTSGDVYLADILYNETALFYFMEYMEMEGAISLLQFLMAVDNFQELLSAQKGCYDGMQAQGDAMVIYEKYFSLQASTPLGFDDKVRFEVESNICREGGPLPDCFQRPKSIVFHHIDKNYFATFLQGELYFKYLSELINTVQTTLDVPNPRKKRSGSDASSEHSIGATSTGSSQEPVSAKNTLLAMDSTNQFCKALSKIGDDLRIDTLLLTNPETLYLRPNSGNMSLGKVNEIGQFISEFDPEPERDKRKGGGSYFTKRRKEQEKAQEDMAWQIAQMIINDVNHMTHVTTEEKS